jgi:hypothetical protein
MENSVPLDHDLYMSYDDIKAISEITWKHPIDWGHIRTAIEDAIPLIDYMGPDAISYVVNKEKKIRNLPAISSYDPKCGFNGWEYDDKDMENLNEPNR